MLFDLAYCIFEIDMVSYIYKEQSSNIQNAKTWILPYPSLNSPKL